MSGKALKPVPQLGLEPSAAISHCLPSLLWSVLGLSVGNFINPREQIELPFLPSHGPVCFRLYRALSVHPEALHGAQEGGAASVVGGHTSWKDTLTSQCRRVRAERAPLGESGPVRSSSQQKIAKIVLPFVFLLSRLCRESPPVLLLENWSCFLFVSLL